MESQYKNRADGDSSLSIFECVVCDCLFTKANWEMIIGAILIEIQIIYYDCIFRKNYCLQRYISQIYTSVMAKQLAGFFWVSLQTSASDSAFELIAIFIALKTTKDKD